MALPLLLEKRVARLRIELDKAGFAGAVISRPEHVYYFTGVSIPRSPIFFILGLPEACLIAPAHLENTPLAYSIYSYQVSALEPVFNVDKSVRAAMIAGLQGTGLSGKPIGIETRHLSHHYATQVAQESMIAGDVGPLVEQLRYCKDAYEIDRLQANQAINDIAFKVAQRSLHPGMSEIELYNQLYASITQEIQTPFAWRGCLGGGRRSALENPQPGAYAFQPGDLVLLDIFSEFDHYYSDSTRTFVVGEATKRQLELHKILEEAIATGEQWLKPGVRACDVDSAIRSVIASTGYKDYFPHHSGHGLGLWQQEQPYLIPGNPCELQANCVIALEPGIYLPDFGGLRLENVYFVTDAGPKIVTGTASLLLESTDQA